ncbi:urea ABC transporter permease subunit UrtB [Thalassobius taeanensis]|uniref:Amino acid/amide ABC transporter membrane protein 1, HAAT family n=1 Tax=Thalassovita taeanensis TaxID=657014 RepID=A0A1H9DN10_9RHOB|nr:amino acid/amide ABC transporter membrane protein 1, HAAT family [Thalassovita taeanensis]
MRHFLFSLIALVMLVCTTQAQAGPVQDIMQNHRAVIEKSSRKTIEPAITALAESGLSQAQLVLEKWQSKDMWQRKADGLFFYAEKSGKNYRLIDFDSNEAVGEFPKSDLDQLKPNSGVRALIGTALVQFQLSDPDPVRRRDALTSIERSPMAEHLLPLRAAIKTETDPVLKAKKQRLERLLSMAFDKDLSTRISAIESFGGDLGVDVRATLNPLLTTRRAVVPGNTLPEGLNLAARLKPGTKELPRAEAYDMLVKSGYSAARISDAELRSALAANIENGQVGGIPVPELNTLEARDRAYAALAARGKVDPTVLATDVTAALAAHSFFDAYDEPSSVVTDAARGALRAIEQKVGLNQVLDLTLDALSLGSIYFLAAIGLAITFGVMGVINMAHGEFIMMGAYTGYVIQQIIPDYTLSIIVAIPMAFAVTFAAGVAMERLVIRWLYNRPLETLLATFGISIALQQIAKNIFGTQARPLTSPGWLDGAWVLNDVVSISYIRIAIFVLALIFLAVFLFIMKRTRLGLETRAVTQNPRMASSMGINKDKVNMLTFGLGSGIAGVAGVAIGLYAKVTSELGSDYIVQSFMTVVVGGVGNIWGTLLGATMIGFLQKGIEWLNPSNTLAAQTYMIVFIIIFIQFRPRGIIALKGRAAGD